MADSPAAKRVKNARIALQRATEADASLEKIDRLTRKVRQAETEKEIRNTARR